MVTGRTNAEPVEDVSVKSAGLAEEWDSELLVTRICDLILSRLNEADSGQRPREAVERRRRR